ncbi:MAG: murein biosynthesis integral membrane protein MurJ [Planctomycetota bacterium]|nr:MAG: murein biosynthesis integral membrane protein MurJ [Planctomycetota bacterium]
MAAVSGNDGGGRHALRGALVMSVWTLVSRVLGFIRDALMLSIFGASAGQGAFLLAWTVPNLFRKLLGEGAVSAAVQPALMKAEVEEGEASAKALFASFQGFLLLLLVVVVGIGEIVIWTWRAQLELGADHFDLRRTLYFSGFLLPYVIPICLCALCAAPQNLRDRFWRPALAPVMLNAVWIVGLLVLSSSFDYNESVINALCAVILVGGLLQWILQWTGLRDMGWPVKPHLQLHDPRRNRAIRAFAPALLGMAALQINVAIDQILVRSLVNETANNYSFYANRMLHLPLALVGVAAMTGSMPLFAKLAAQGKLQELGRVLTRGCESTLLLICAAGIGMGVIAHPLLTLMFQHGEFTADDVNLLTPTLLAYLWVLPFATVGGMLTRAHQSLGSYRLPAIAAAVSIPVNLVLDVILLPRLGVPGAGWATTASMAVQTVILLFSMSRIGLSRPVHLRRLPGVLLPGVVAGFAAWAALEFTPTDSFIPGLGVGFAVLAGGFAGAITTWLARPDDFRDLIRALKR